jgi:Txe/YoeB family toxin of Txe-Axe toxin-antitoxin module
VRPYTIRFTREAAKDVGTLPPRVKKKLKEILSADIALDPFSGKKLVGDLQGFHSTRLTYRDRIVYSIDQKSRIVFIHQAQTHYGE